MKREAPNAGRARAVLRMLAPFGEISVGPGALDQIGARVIAVGGTVEQEMRAGGGDVARAKFAEDALPDAAGQAGRLRLQHCTAVGEQRLAVERAIEQVGAARGRLAPLRDRQAEGRKRHFVKPAADAKLNAPAADEVDRRRVLGEPQRVLQRNGHHRGAEPDARGAFRDGGEQDEGRGAGAGPGAAVLEMVLGDPAAVEAKLLGRDELGDQPAI